MINCVAWSLDDRFIYSGSSEFNVRIWKARACEKLGVVSGSNIDLSFSPLSRAHVLGPVNRQVKPRERRAQHVNARLIEKFSHHPEVKSIKNHRHVPKHIYSGRKEAMIMRHSAKRK